MQHGPSSMRASLRLRLCFFRLDPLFELRVDLATYQFSPYPHLAIVSANLTSFPDRMLLHARDISKMINFSRCSTKAKWQVRSKRRWCYELRRVRCLFRSAGAITV
jgi:hypothetical protein